MRLVIAAYALTLSFALSVIMVSLMSTSPSAAQVRLVALVCAGLAVIALVRKLRELP